MPTDPAIIKAELDNISASVDHLRALLLEDPSPPPPPSYVMPEKVAAISINPNQVEVAVTHPTSIPVEYSYMVIAWGSDSRGFINSTTFSRPFPTRHTIGTIAPLPIEPITISIGYGIDLAPVPPDKLVQVVITPKAPPTPPPSPDQWPAAASWADKIAWIKSRAGTARSLPVRQSVTPTSVPDGCTWDGRTLMVRDTALIKDLVVPGRIYVRPSSTAPTLTLRNVKAEDVFASEAGGYRTTLVEDCEFSMPSNRVTTERWGQGNLNAMGPNFVVRRTLCRGGADNMQASQNGLLEECWFTAMSIDPSWTHDDFIQLYGGRLNIRRCLFTQDLQRGEENHVNGIFADGGVYDIEDSAIIVTAPPGTNAWAMHAAKYQTPHQIVVRNSYVRGRTIGAVSFGPDVDYGVGY